MKRSIVSSLTSLIASVFVRPSLKFEVNMHLKTSDWAINKNLKIWKNFYFDFKTTNCLELAVADTDDCVIFSFLIQRPQIQMIAFGWCHIWITRIQISDFAANVKSFVVFKTQIICNVPVNNRVVPLITNFDEIVTESYNISIIWEDLYFKSTSCFAEFFIGLVLEPELDVNHDTCFDVRIFQHNSKRIAVEWDVLLV